MAEESSNKWSWIWFAIAAAAIAAAVYLYLHPRTVTVTKTETFQAPPQIERVETVKKVYVPGPTKVVVLDKAAVAQKLDMPWLEKKEVAPATPAAPADQLAAGDALPAPAPAPAPVDQPQAKAAEESPVQGDPQDLQVTTTADLEESDNGYEAASVLNTKTGESAIVVKEKVAPWIQIENGVVAGLRYGLNTKGGQTLTPYAGYEFMRIRDLHLIGYAEGNANMDGRWVKDMDGKIQLDIQYRRK